MARPRRGQAPAGSVRYRRGRWEARIAVGTATRTYPLLWTEPGDRKQAQERAAVLSKLAYDLREAGALEVADNILRTGAGTEAQLEDARRGAKAILRGTRAVRPGSTPDDLVTFREVAIDWTSGRLHQRFPDHVASKDPTDDLSRMKLILPVVGDVPLRLFTRDHADAVMRALPSGLATGTRRQYGQVVCRVLQLAVEPLRILQASPIPRGWLPKLGARKAGSYLYPSEESALLAHVDVALPVRVMPGFLAREGMRKSEAARMTWSDLDLERGAVALDENKTKEPRAWALGADVAEALRRWRERPGDPSGDTLVFTDDDGAALAELQARDLRGWLRAAGVTRPQLFERSEQRMQVRVHDTRASFVTLALAAGRPEAWVTDRTGHRSSGMVAKYKRAARTAAELGLGWLHPMHDAIPELQNLAQTWPDSSENPASRVKPRRFGLVSDEEGARAVLSVR